jgi:hypothetical protein
MCMFGANACPNGTVAPAGTAWCVCVDLEGNGSMEWICYADCFTAANGSTPPTSTNTQGTGYWAPPGAQSWCVNSNNRSCGLGNTNATAWPTGIEARAGGGRTYVCTRVFLMSSLPGQWTPDYNEYLIPVNYPGTYITPDGYFQALEPGEPGCTLPAPYAWD